MLGWGFLYYDKTFPNKVHIYDKYTPFQQSCPELQIEEERKYTCLPHKKIYSANMKCILEYNELQITI